MNSPTTRTGAPVQLTLRELNGLRVLVLHPHDSESHHLTAHLRRIGCTSVQQWPIPDEVSIEADIVFLTIEESYRAAIQTFAQSFRELSPPLVGIVEYENPATLQLVIESGCAGVIERPIRPFGLLTQLLLARTAWKQRAENLAQIRKLQGRYAAVSKLSMAKTLLIARQGITESEAHRLIRCRAMAARISLESMAEVIIGELP